MWGVGPGPVAPRKLVPVKINTKSPSRSLRRIPFVDDKPRPEEGSAACGNGDLTEQRSHVYTHVEVPAKLTKQATAHTWA